MKEIDEIMNENNNVDLDKWFAQLSMDKKEQITKVPKKLDVESWEHDVESRWYSMHDTVRNYWYKKISGEINEVITIDSDTARENPRMISQIQKEIGDEGVIDITEDYVKNLINENEKPKISKNKLLKSLNLK